MPLSPPKAESPHLPTAPVPRPPRGGGRWAFPLSASDDGGGSGGLQGPGLGVEPKKSALRSEPKDGMEWDGVCGYLCFHSFLEKQEHNNLEVWK